MEQLSFQFPITDHYLKEDFIRSKENVLAFDFVNTYEISNTNLPKIFCIQGSRFSGKTHLAKIWQRKSKATFLKISILEFSNLGSYIENNGCYVIEDLDFVTSEEVLFHLLNEINAKKSYLLITTSVPLGKIKYKFSDLSSRLNNIFTLKIERPEIPLIKALLLKHFAHNQLLVENQVLNYLTNNIERDYEAIYRFIKLLKFYCFEQNRKVTIPFVAEILDKVNS